MMTSILCSMEDMQSFYFVEDYNKLIESRENPNYSLVISLYYSFLEDKENTIYFKRYFDRLVNPYDYLEYKSLICNDNRLKRAYEFISNNMSIEESELCLLLGSYCIVGTYLGFIIEQTIIEELNQSINTKHNNILDRIGIDLAIEWNGLTYNLQIKSETFLNKENKHYKKYIGKNIALVFYHLTDGNIEIVCINGEPILKADDLKDLDLSNKSKEYISFNEWLDRIIELYYE